ncbi:unnamed protein product, partial [marine sediment metagenome]
AFQLGRHAGMKQAGVKEKEWLTSRDGLVRTEETSAANHVELDGEQVDISETFSNGLEHPGDPSGPPEEVINCRCDSIPAGSAD